MSLFLKNKQIFRSKGTWRLKLILKCFRKKPSILVYIQIDTDTIIRCGKMLSLDEGYREFFLKFGNICLILKLLQNLKKA